MSMLLVVEVRVLHPPSIPGHTKKLPDSEWNLQAQGGWKEPISHIGRQTDVKTERQAHLCFLFPDSKPHSQELKGSGSLGSAPGTADTHPHFHPLLGTRALMSSK